MKALKFISCLMKWLIILLYLCLIYAASRMFSIFPWYDENGNYLLLLLLVWIPLCVFTLIHIVLLKITKKYYKPLAALEALNALYIPIIFLLGIVGITINGLRIIGVSAFITIIIYIVLSIVRARKER